MPKYTLSDKANFLAALQPAGSMAPQKKAAASVAYPAMTTSLTTGSLQGQWEATKAAWKKVGERTVGTDVAAQMKALGWGKGDLASKLKKFDKAKDLEARRGAWAVAFPQLKLYETVLEDAKKKPLLPAGSASLDAMLKVVLHLLKMGHEATQDPKPSGKDIKVKLLYSRSASGGVRPEWLKGGTLTMNAYLVMDEKLLELEKADMLGFHWIEMQRACNAVADKHIADFQHVIGKLDERFALIAAELTTIAKDRKIMNIRRNEQGH